MADTDSKADRERVARKITWAIIDFMRRRLASGRLNFKADDLRRYAIGAVGAQMVAPGSPDRIMRQLRQGGTVDYVLVSRSKSLYRVVFVKPEKAAKRRRSC